MENYIEHGNEHIPTKEEILNVIGRHAESYIVGRELSDEKGLYLFEVKIEGGKAGETTEYQYMRKGTFPNHNESLETTIHVIYFENGIPAGGHDIANYNSETGEWKDVE